MRIVELSNHPAAMLAVERRVRTQARADAMERGRLPWSRLRVLRWLRGVWAALRMPASRSMGPVVGGQRVSADEHRLLAGVRGERLAAGTLAGALDDRWVLLGGYRNRRGEIDQLLLGPGGLFAIEVKHRNATIHCDADTWAFQKYDRYGNEVERGDLADRRGRSPARQLVEPADALGAFLASRRQPVAINRVVVFSHPRSRLGEIRNPTVHVLADPQRLLGLVRGCPAVLPERRLARIERLIIRDHEFHEQRRGRACGRAQTVGAGA